MNDEEPIVCSLSAGDMKQRLSDIADVGQASLLAVDGMPDRPVLRFRDDAETRRRVQEIVAAEATCCAFLDLDVRQEADGLRLTISGPEHATPVIGDLVAAFQQQRA